LYASATAIGTFLDIADYWWDIIEVDKYKHFLESVYDKKYTGDK
jgi:hypothetical protein